MKLIFVTENLGSGGAERQLTGLSVFLAAKGHKCTVVTWIDKNFYSSYLADNNVEHILLRPKGRIDRIKKLASLFRIKSPDAVISFLPMANETAALASLITPVKLIVSERSFTTDWGLRRRLTNLLYHRATYVVANSNNEAENIRNHCPGLASRILAIPNYVDIDKFSNIKHCGRNTAHPIRLVGVGRVIPSKNIINLLRALAILKSEGVKFTFDWYGDTYDKIYFAEIIQCISDLNLAGEFVLRGECQDIAKVYQSADLMCIPSTLEGYPNVLVEAMASGLPVVVSDVCEHPHIIEEAVNGFLFNPYDVDAIANAIRKAINLSDTELLEISESNRQKVIANNSVDSFCDKYLALL